jgi:hypothetical protein
MEDLQQPYEQCDSLAASQISPSTGSPPPANMYMAIGAALPSLAEIYAADRVLSKPSIIL